MSTKVKSPENLPKKPGVYIMRDANDEIIYIGKAKNLINRVRSYFREKLDRPKTQILMSHFDSLEYIVTNSEKEALIRYADLIGLAFQIKDDLLDIEGTFEDIGKPVGSDLKLEKSTYPAIFGIEKTKIMLDEKISEAKKIIIENFHENNKYFLELADYIGNRKK